MAALCGILIEVQLVGTCWHAVGGRAFSNRLQVLPLAAETGSWQLAKCLTGMPSLSVLLAHHPLCGTDMHDVCTYETPGLAEQTQNRIDAVTGSNDRAIVTKA